MENYVKGKNVEEILTIDKVPIANLPTNVVWMQVRGGTKITNVLSYALKKFDNKDDIACLWTGFGPSVEKTVSCAEIMKKRIKNKLHQITKICFREVEEYWDSVIPELDQIVVKRKLPMVHIFLSSKSLDSSELGYQSPGQFIPYKQDNSFRKRNRQNNGNKNTPKAQKRTSPSEKHS